MQEMLRRIPLSRSCWENVIKIEITAQPFGWRQAVITATVYTEYHVMVEGWGTASWHWFLQPIQRFLLTLARYTLMVLSWTSQWCSPSFNGNFRTDLFLFWRIFMDHIGESPMDILVYWLPAERHCKGCVPPGLHVYELEAEIRLL